MSYVNLAGVCSHLQNASRARLAVTSIKATKLHANLMLAMQREGILSAVEVAGSTPPNSLITPGASQDESEERIPTNPADRRIWVGLKYYNNEPVLSSMAVLMKRKNYSSLDIPKIQRLLQGRSVGDVRGIVRPDQCVFFKTDRGILEARECMTLHTGGHLLCQVNGGKR